MQASRQPEPCRNAPNFQQLHPGGPPTPSLQPNLGSPTQATEQDTASLRAFPDKAQNLPRTPLACLKMGIPSYLQGSCEG